MDDAHVTLRTLRDEVAAFAAARDWERFHHPKDVAIGLVLEASEVLETFQWDTRDLAALRADDRLMAEVRDEMADVLNYLLNLANVLDVDLAAAFRDKMAKNEAKYPVEKAKGSAAKYTRF